MNVLSTGLFEGKIFFCNKIPAPENSRIFANGLLFYNQIQFTFRVLQESSAFRLLGISENNAHCELIVLHFSKL